MQSNSMVRKSFFYMNTLSETFTPLVCSVIDDALLKARAAIPVCPSVHVKNFSETF